MQVERGQVRELNDKFQRGYEIFGQVKLLHCDRGCKTCQDWHSQYQFMRAEGWIRDLESADPKNCIPMVKDLINMRSEPESGHWRDFQDRKGRWWPEHQLNFNIVEAWLKQQPTVEDTYVPDPTRQKKKAACELIHTTSINNVATANNCNVNMYEHVVLLHPGEMTSSAALAEIGIDSKHIHVPGHFQFRDLIGKGLPQIHDCKLFELPSHVKGRTFMSAFLDLCGEFGRATRKEIAHFFLGVKKAAYFTLSFTVAHSRHEPQSHWLSKTRPFLDDLFKAGGYEICSLDLAPPPMDVYYAGNHKMFFYNYTLKRVGNSKPPLLGPKATEEINKLEKNLAAWFSRFQANQGKSKERKAKRDENAIAQPKRRRCAKRIVPMSTRGRPRNQDGALRSRDASPKRQLGSLAAFRTEEHPGFLLGYVQLTDQDMLPVCWLKREERGQYTRDGKGLIDQSLLLKLDLKLDEKGCLSNEQALSIIRSAL